MVVRCILDDMNQVTATIFRRSGKHQIYSLALACAFVVMALLQLFSLEDMPTALSVLLPAGFVMNTHALMALIVVIEVFAIPYFLPIALSPLARLCAAICALLTPLVWGGLNLYTASVNQAANAGFLSPKLHLEAGFGSIFMLAALYAAVVGLMIWDRHTPQTA